MTDMKRKCAMAIILLIFLLPQSIYAELLDDGNKMGSVAGIATNYIKWAEIYRVSDFDPELHYSTDVSPNNEKSLIIDDLGIIYDNSDLQATWISLFYINKSTSALDMVNQWKRASSLFGAIVYGDPSKFSDDDIETVKQKVDGIMNQLNDTMSIKQESLSNGGSALFYQSGSREFYLQYIKDENQWMITVK